jgi:predicted DNA-binding protein
MAKKIQFSARKDPLLRPAQRPQDSAAPESEAAAAGTDVEATTAAAEGGGESVALADAGAGATPTGDVAATWAAPARRTPPRGRTNGRSVEEPAGVVAVEPPPTPARRRARAKPAAAADMRPPESPDTAPHATRHRSAARRVQTSISMPPAAWDRLDKLAHDASAPTGELLSAILTSAVPDSAEDALAMIEQLLTTDSPDQGFHEERNFRLTLELREQLDTIAKALAGGPRLQRSLVVRGIVAAAIPTNADDARALLTTVRLNNMRAAMTAATAH